MLNVKNLFQGFLIITTALSVAGGALADDTDIYLSSSASQSSVVDGMIMLILESRPNTGSALCSDATADTCRSTLGDEVYEKLTATVANGGLGIDTGKVYLADALRAVYLVLLPELANSGNSFHIGLMNSHANDNDSKCIAGSLDYECSKGAYILRGMEPISDSGSLEELLTIIRAFPRGDGSGNVSHPYQAKAIYHEYYRYLTGGGVWNGALGFNDFASLTDSLNLGETDNKDFITWDTSTDSWKNPLHKLDPDTTILTNAGTSNNRKIEDKDVEYVSPFANANYDFACTKVYAFNNTVGTYDPDSSSDAQLATDVGGLDGSKLKFADVVSRFYNLDVASPERGDVDLDGLQNVVSYFLIPAPKKQDHDLAALGGTGSAFDTSDPKQLLKDLRKAFNDIATRSSTLVAASVPVNVFNRSDIVNNVFLAIFEVNDDGYPFWPGNLKKLRLEEQVDETSGEVTIKIVAANGVAGFSPLDGRISTSAISYWTDTTDLPTAITARSELDGRDGRSVTMGGAGQNIPGYAANGTASPGADNATGARQLYIEPTVVDSSSASGTEVTGLAADDAAKTSEEMQSLVLAEGDDAAQLEANTLNRLRWLRGMDPVGLWGGSGDLDGNNDVDQTRSYIHLDTDGDGTKDEWRRWVLGDALHSLPLTINYGNRAGYDGDGADNILGTEDDNPDIRIFMGTNDGVFHQFKNTESTGGESGAEVWGFMPRALMDIVAKLPEQAPIVPAHPYGVDGVPVAFVIDNNDDGTITHAASCTTGDADCDKVYVYFGLRRGGKAYYALDVSNPDNPPKVLWRIRQPQVATGASGSYEASALTFDPGMALQPGDYNEGILTIDGADYAVRHNTGTEVVLADALPGSAAIDVSFTLTSPGESDFAEMGMSFSTPRTGWVKYNDTPTPVLIFAGGYHGGWNPEDNTRKGKDDLAHTGPDPEGAAVFIVHARTGELIWKAIASGTVSDQVHVQSLLTDSIPSEVATLDSDGNAIIDRLYVGDSGGTVWRIDLPEYPIQPVDGTPTTSCGESDQRRCWFTSQFASLGDAADDGGTDDRRFFHAPRVVQAVDENSPAKYDAVVIGSGDRAHPKMDTHAGTDYVDNYFFVLKDRTIVSGDESVKTRTALAIGDLKDITDDCMATVCSDLDLTKGWKLQLEVNGEKNLSSPLVVAGNVFFTTYLPEGGDSTDACAPQVGSSRLYIVNFREGNPVFNLSGTVSGSLGKADRFKKDVEGIGGDVISLGPKFIMTPGGQVFESGSEGRSTTYWRDKGQDRIKH